MIPDATSNHATIQFWASTHGAHPAERLPEFVDSVQPVLCFIFHRSSNQDGRVVPISWDEFFERFDLLDLAFIGDLDTCAVPAAYEILCANKPTPRITISWLTLGKTDRSCCELRDSFGPPKSGCVRRVLPCRLGKQVFCQAERYDYFRTRSPTVFVSCQDSPYKGGALGHAAAAPGIMA